MFRVLFERPTRLGLGLALGLVLALAITPARAQLASTAGSTASGTSTSTSVGGGTGGAASLYQNSYGSSNETIHNTPDLQTPGLFGGTNPCSVGVSGGLSIAGLGLGGGGLWSDRGCERRNAAVILFQAGMPDVAVALLCQDSQIREAFREAGKPCPADRAAAVVATAAPVTRPVSLNMAPVPASPQVATTAVEAARVAAANAHARRKQRFAEQPRFTPPSWCSQPITSDSDRASFNYYCHPPAVTGLASASQAVDTTAEATAVR